jgi:hypothetical protein
VLKHSAFTLLPFSIIEILRGGSMTVRSRRRKRAGRITVSEEQNDTFHSFTPPLIHCNAGKAIKIEMKEENSQRKDGKD